MKQDEYSARPTLNRNRSPTVEPRWAQPKTDHQAPTNLRGSFSAGAIIKSESRRRAIKVDSKLG